MLVDGRGWTTRWRAATSCMVGVALFGLAGGCGQTDHDKRGSGAATSSSGSGGVVDGIHGGGSGQNFAGGTGSSGTAGATLVDGGSVSGGGDGNAAGAPTREPGPCMGDRAVRNQADYEALMEERCTEISGSLTVRQDGDLSYEPGLQTLTRVGGSVSVVSNPALTSLLTFAGLESVGGDFTLLGAERLSSLAGLEHLESVGGSLAISGTAVATLAELSRLTSLPDDLLLQGSLKSLEGRKLTSIGRTLALTDTLLESLAGLEQLTSVGTLQILRAPQLASTGGLSNLIRVDRVDLSGIPARSLDGFDHITELANGLSLQNCTGLTSLEAFSTVSRIGDGIRIGGNDALESLRGLDHLLETPKLLIAENAALTSLSGLEGLESVTSLDIVGNAALGSISALAALKQVDSVTVDGNDALTSLHGLEQLSHVRSLWIAKNPLLSTLAAFTSWPAHALSAHCHINANPVLPQCLVDAFDEKQLDVECSNEGGANLDNATCN